MGKRSIERFAKELILLDKLISPFNILRFLVPRTKGHNQNVCFIKLYEKGAIAMIAPLLKEIIDKKKLNVYLITLDTNKDIMFLLPSELEERTYFVDTRSIYRIIISLVKIRHWSKKMKIGVSLNFEIFSNISKIVEIIIGAKKQFGIGKDQSECCVEYSPARHMIDMYSDLINIAINLDKPQIKYPMISIKEKESSIGLYINTLDPLWHRSWPLGRWQELIANISNYYGSEYKIKVFTTDGKKNTLPLELAKYFVETKSIKNLINEVEKLKVFITTDCGPSHFAAYTSTNVITLFGPESEHVFHSPNPKGVALSKKISCSPCFNQYNKCLSDCRQNKCMQDIFVSDVMAELKKIIGVHSVGA